MLRFLILPLCALLLPAPVLDAQTAPRLTLSVNQVQHGESVTMKLTGFSPNGVVLSEMIRPDGSHYPEMPLDTDARGELSHLVTIVPENYGTYELRVIDADTKRTASSRFMLTQRGHARPLAGAEASTPAAFTGVWEGSVRQTPKEAPVPVVLTLAGGVRGSIVGTVAYPGRSCGGEVWLIGAGPDFVQLGELITYGGGTCIGRAIVTARLSREGRLQFDWRDINQAGTAAAELSKVQ